MVEPLSTERVQDYILHINKCLGKGAYGTVYEGHHIVTQAKLAIKRIDLDPNASESLREKLDQMVTKEIKALKDLQHDNMIKFVNSVTTEHHLYIITELCEDGDLGKRILQKSVFQAQAVRYIRQICEAMVYANRKDYLHRDIKPENILLQDDNVKIADFGFAKCKENAALKTDQTICGTPLYMAPEIGDNTPYCSKCDVWSTGVVFYQLLTGEPPWNGKNQRELREKIKNNGLSFPPECKISDDLKDLIGKMLEINQDKRFTFQQALEHPALMTNPVEEFFNYLTQSAEFLAQLGVEIRKKRKKLGFEQELSYKMKGVLIKLALHNRFRIVNIMNHKEEPEENEIPRSALEKKKNFKKLKIDYENLFKEAMKDFVEFVEEADEVISDKDFKSIVLVQNSTINTEFKKKYRLTFEEAIEVFLKKKEELINENTNAELLRIILKILKIKTVNRVFDEFSFQVELGKENDGLFTDFQDAIDSKESASLVRRLNKMLEKI